MSMFEWQGQQIPYTAEEIEGAKKRLANYAKELGYSDRSFDIRVVLAELVHQTWLVRKQHAQEATVLPLRPAGLPEPSPAPERLVVCCVFCCQPITEQDLLDKTPRPAGSTIIAQATCSGCRRRID